METLDKNIDDTFEDAKKQVDMYRQLFMQNINELENETKIILSNLEEMTCETADLENKIQENEDLIEWVNEIENDVMNLLKF